MESKGSVIESNNADLQRKLVAWAADFPERFPDLVLLDPEDPSVEISPRTALAQQPETFYVEGKPIDPAILEAAVEDIDSRFLSMLDVLEQKEAETGFLTQIGQNLEAGKNVIVAANHENIGNLGFVLGAYICSLRNKGYDFRTSIIIGKAAPFVGCKIKDKVESLVDVLAYGCNDIFIGYPDTGSTTKAGIPEDTAYEHNKRMSRPLLKTLKASGNLIGIDPTGKTNRVVDGVVSLGRVNDATANILSRADTLVTTTEIWLENGLNVFTTDGRLYNVQDKKRTKSGKTISIDHLMSLHFDALRTHVDPSVAVFELEDQAADFGNVVPEPLVHAQAYRLGKTVLLG